MNNIFLIIDDILIPDMERGNLKIYRVPLDVTARMISGRLTMEKRGYYWRIEANFSDIDTELLQQIDAALLANDTHTITFLPPTGGAEVLTEEFYLTSSPKPGLKSWMEELPEWSGFAYVFEEVRPHVQKGAGA